MKTVLILVLSADWHPYKMLMQSSMDTWDSIYVAGTETVFYCSYSDKPSTDKVIYLPVGNDLFSIGKKTIMAFEWALENKSFDYICRPGANCFIHKSELLKHIQNLSETNLFSTLEIAATETTKRWGWGHGIILSRDVVQQVVNNKDQWDHKEMEDVAMSHLIDELGIPFYPATACSIDKLPSGRWVCNCYATPSFEFDDFSEIVKAKGQYNFRCKQDYDRNQDVVVMNELFKYLQ